MFQARFVFSVLLFIFCNVAGADAETQTRTEKWREALEALDRYNKESAITQEQ